MSIDAIRAALSRGVSYAEASLAKAVANPAAVGATSVSSADLGAAPSVYDVPYTTATATLVNELKADVNALRADVVNLNATIVALVNALRESGDIL